MLSKFITEVKTKFNPFSRSAKAARLFLARLPPNARKEMKIKATMLPMHSKEPATLQVAFKDGHKIDFDLEKLKLPGVLEEVNRHSRQLARKEELTAS